MSLTTLDGGLERDDTQIGLDPILDIDLGVVKLMIDDEIVSVDAGAYDEQDGYPVTRALDATSAATHDSGTPCYLIIRVRTTGTAVHVTYVDDEGDTRTNLIDLYQQTPWAGGIQILPVEPLDDEIQLGSGLLYALNVAESDAQLRFAFRGKYAAAEDNNNEMTYVAREIGEAGNGIGVAITADEPNDELEITVVGRQITAKLAVTDEPVAASYTTFLDD